MDSESPDQSHVVYSDEGVKGQCPKTHPVRLVELFYSACGFHDHHRTLC